MRIGGVVMLVDVGAGMIVRLKMLVNSAANVQAGSFLDAEGPAQVHVFAGASLIAIVRCSKARGGAELAGGRLASKPPDSKRKSCSDRSSGSSGSA